uniref:Uncharacterized protein n=1 Tax=Trypanosoma vivax (strain Y486) TaxID=1055687 RepID=G0U9Y1_TRYVY|nr:hypothetical protein TVY486_1100970 [Trypanosoma vivax Y486]
MEWFHVRRMDKHISVHAFHSTHLLPHFYSKKQKQKKNYDDDDDDVTSRPSEPAGGCLLRLSSLQFGPMPLTRVPFPRCFFFFYCDGTGDVIPCAPISLVSRVYMQVHACVRLCLCVRVRKGGGGGGGESKEGFECHFGKSCGCRGMCPFVNIGFMPCRAAG